LTYTVNLTLILPKLSSNDQESEIDAQGLARHIMERLWELFQDESVANHGAFVIKKMLSNLALIFAVCFREWTNPLEDFILSAKTAHPLVRFGRQNDGAFNEGTIAQFLESSSPVFIGTFLTFSQIMAEELTKKDVSHTDKSDLHTAVHEKLFPTTESVATKIFTGTNGANTEMWNIWLPCFNSWVSYASKAEFDSTARYNMTPLLRIAVQRMANEPIPWKTDVPERIIDFLVESLDINSTFFVADTKNDLKALIFGPWGRQLLSVTPEVSDQFARLTILLLECDMVQLAMQIANEESSDVFEFLLRLTDFPGMPVVEETISSDFIEFWMQMVDSLTEDTERFKAYLDGDEAKISLFNKKSRALLNNVAHIYWRKIHIPVDEDAIKGYEEEFRVFRRDAGDLFEAIYPIVRNELYHSLSGNVLYAVEQFKNSKVPQGEERAVLNDIEASMYLINAISEDFSEENAPQEIVEDVYRLLNSEVLQLVTGYRVQGSFQHFIYTAIRFVASVSWLYGTEQGLTCLPVILNFLFDNMMDSPTYELISSRAIAEICDNCRLSLQETLPNFKNIVTEMIENVSVDSITRERIINSYSSIIQGVRDPQVQGEYLHRLLELLLKHSTEMLNRLDGLPKEQLDQVKEYLISIISCVSAIGRGMQLPDAPEDVYTDPKELQLVSKYWTEDPLGIHAQILQIVQNFAMGSEQLFDNLKVAEEIEAIFKSGLTESMPGPFVFPPELITQFITAKIATLKTFNTLPLLYDLFGKVIRANHRDMSAESVSRTLEQIWTGFQSQKVDSSDPDIVQALIGMLAAIAGSSPGMLLRDSRLLQAVVVFCIEQLGSKERFVLQSLEQFWTKLIHLRRGNRQDTITVRRLFDETDLGHMLMYNLLKSLLVTQRSNISYFTEILKAVVAKYPMLAKQWMMQSLEKINRERLESGQKAVSEYELFVKRVMLTRGTRTANGLVKDFWLKTNGLVDYDRRL